MEYQLIFSPRLELTPDDFVALWNAETDTQAAAQAHLTSSSQAKSYNPLLDLVTLVLVPVGLGLGTNALYDLITSVFEKQGRQKHIKITKLDLPDGTHFLTLDIDE